MGCTASSGLFRWCTRDDAQPDEVVPSGRRARQAKSATRLPRKRFIQAPEKTVTMSTSRSNTSSLGLGGEEVETDDHTVVPMTAIPAGSARFCGHITQREKDQVPLTSVAGCVVATNDARKASLSLPVRERPWALSVTLQDATLFTSGRQVLRVAVFMSQGDSPHPIYAGDCEGVIVALGNLRIVEDLSITLHPAPPAAGAAAGGNDDDIQNCTLEVEGSLSWNVRDLAPADLEQGFQL